MKPIRVTLLVAVLTALVAPAHARGATRPEPYQAAAQLPETARQLHPGERGVLIADEYQVPVVEGVEPLDSPAAEAADADAAVPAAEPPSDQEQPAAENPPDVEQPDVEP